MTPHAPAILLIGDDRAAEMRPVAAALERMAPDADVRRAATAAVAREQLAASDWRPDLVILCQRWPDESSRAEIERLIAALPLARWTVCYGAWCESDGRTRILWPLAVRVPARACAPRLRHELDVLAGRCAPLPLTAARDEIFQFDSAEPPPPMPLGLNVAVVTPDAPLRRFLCDWLRTFGCRVVPRCEEAAVILCDADPLDTQSDNTLQQLRSSCADATLIALTALAHPSDIERLTASGAAAVVAKLNLSSELPDYLSSI